MTDRCITRTEAETRAYQDGSTQIWVPVKGLTGIGNMALHLLHEVLCIQESVDLVSECEWRRLTSLGIRCPYSVGETLVFREAHIARYRPPILSVGVKRVHSMDVIATGVPPWRRRDYCDSRGQKDCNRQDSKSCRGAYGEGTPFGDCDCECHSEVHRTIVSWNARYPKHPWRDNPWCWKIVHKAINKEKSK